MTPTIARNLSHTAPASGRLILQIQAPATGDVCPLDQLTNPLLQAGLLGTGAAIIMTTGEVISPIDCVVESVDFARSQINLLHRNGLKLLLQIGQPGEIACSERIIWRVKKGQRCEAGDNLLLSDPLWMKQQGASPACIVTILNGGKLSAIVLTSATKVRIKDDSFIALYR